jgi:predicted Zn-dependent protease
MIATPTLRYHEACLDLAEIYLKEHGLAGRSPRDQESRKKRLLDCVSLLRDNTEERLLNEVTAIARQTQAPGAYLALAGAQMNCRLYDSALITLDILLFAHPKCHHATLAKGLVLCAAGSLDKGHAHVHEAVQADPGLWLGWQVLIDLAGREGNQHEAERLIGEALWHEPGIGARRDFYDRPETRGSGTSSMMKAGMTS